jgi:hypothetical protein
MFTISYPTIKLIKIILTRLANKLLTKLAILANMISRMIKINSGALDNWIQNTDDGMSRLMQATGLSFHTIDRMRRGKYESEPYPKTKRSISMATGLSEKLLFPVTAVKEKAS